MKIEDYISIESLKEIRKQIKKADNNEVFFWGLTNEKKIVNEIRVIARGNSFSVPAVLRDLSAGDAVIHNHPSNNLTPSEADNSIASHLGQFGIASYIVDNSAKNIYTIVEPFEKEITKKINAGDLTKLFSEDGLLSASFDYYEYRPQQIKMVEIVSDAFNRDKAAFIEAGTGTGKTISYLIPAIHWAVNNKEKCVIATNTINLQEQLVNKDLPLIQKLLPTKFNYVLIKGRSNYICMNKFYKSFMQPELFDITGYKNQIDNISEWLKVTDDGSKSSLNFIPDNKLWESICAEADNCLKNKCKFFNECFVNKIRREANAAHILIVNHHILLSDIVYKYNQNNFKINGVLPAYKRIIFDEAHNLEDAAIKHLGIDISRNGIIKTLNFLYNTFQGKERGILQYVKNSVIFKSKIKKKEKILALFDQKIMPLINSLKNDVDLSFDIIKNYFIKNYSKREIFQGFKLRITGEIAADPEFFENCESVLIDLIKQFLELAKYLETLLKNFKIESETSESETDEIIKNDLGYVKIKIDSIHRALSGFINPQDIENTVRWTECPNTQKKEIKLFAAPIDISKLFFNSVVLPHKTVIFTSATLTVNKKFDFLKKIFGMDILSADSTLECILDTPFDYKNQAVFTIPSDLPFPDDFNFTSQTNSFLKKLLLMNERSAFLLFTSYSQLKKTADYLRNELESFDFNIFVQGEKPRSLLLESFKKYRKSILFATDSFWEGVDVQGEALELVVLFKLPFKTPDDPVLEAKNELLVKSGKNPFFEYQLPKAVIKLKQGVGRLIRTKNDYGAIAILDKRIKVKLYGQTFINSLPDMKIIYAPSENCLDEISNFFN